MSAGPRPFWRVFPWDPGAGDGEPFSPGYVPASQGRGRFDLPGRPAGVLYSAETPEHAVAERIQHFRGQTLADADLIAARRRLALASLTVPEDGVADLCDPDVLHQLRIWPDATASRDRQTTQGLAVRVYDAGYAGLRWWSAFSGDWHTIALFRDRMSGGPSFDSPEPLFLETPALRAAAAALGLTLARPRGQRRQTPPVQ